MDLNRALATEMRTLEPICEFSEHDGYRVYQCERFPDYYSGNGIEIQRLGDRDLDAFEGLFTQHFDPTRYQHRTFTFAALPELQPLAAAARGRDYRVYEHVFLVASQPAPRTGRPSSLTIRRVDTPEHWEMMRRFSHLMSRHEPWYTEAAQDELFEKTRFTSQAIGIHWYYLGPTDGDEIWCKLGIFFHGGVGRLQDVDTAPDRRRQGLATMLLGHAIDLALEHADGLVVCADADYHALDLYRKLGFRDLGSAMQLIWYEPKNPTT